MLAAMFAVFTQLFSQMITWIESVVSLFWDPTANSGSGALTILGTLAIVALGISLFFLFVGLVQKFLHLRG